MTSALEKHFAQPGVVRQAVKGSHNLHLLSYPPREFFGKSIPIFPVPSFEVRGHWASEIEGVRVETGYIVPYRKTVSGAHPGPLLPLELCERVAEMQRRVAEEVLKATQFSALGAVQVIGAILSKAPRQRAFEKHLENHLSIEFGVPEHVKQLDVSLPRLWSRYQLVKACVLVWKDSALEQEEADL